METRRDFLEKTAATGIAGIIAAGAAPVYAQGVRVKKSGVSLEEAQELHNKCLMIDGHNDTPVERVARKERVETMMQPNLPYQMDIFRMKQGGFDAGSFIVGNGLVANVWVTIEQTKTMIEENPNDLLLVLSSNDTILAKKTGRVGILMGIEGIAKWVTGELDKLRLFYRLGVRLVGITHGEGGSEPTFLQSTQSKGQHCTPADRENERKTAGGLTPFGHDVLKASNEMGILTDLSHINDKAYYEVLELTTKPAIVSHSGVFTLCHRYRVLTDDQIKALAQNGGAMGIMFAPSTLHDDPKLGTVDRLVEHVCYVADMVGIDHVGIGSDYDGGVKEPVVPEVSGLVEITRSMMSYGFSEEEIKKVWGGNFLRLLQQNID